MAQEMTPEERHAFLMHGTRTAVLATNRIDGPPHAVPIGFILDGDDVLLLTSSYSAKGKNLQRDPRVTLLVQDERPPFAFVMIEGLAEVSFDKDAARRSAAEAIGRRYGPEETIEPFVAYADSVLDAFVRVRPTRIVALERVGE